MSKEEKKKLPGIVKVLIGFASAVILGMLIGCVVIVVKYYQNNKSESVVEADVVPELDEFSSNDKTGATSSNTDTVRQMSSSSSGPVSTADFSQIVDNVMPSIVSINCKIEYSYYSLFGYEDKREGSASGSGFIIGVNGDELLIATNNHVVDDAKTIEVVFCDKKTASAKVKGKDKYYDLAVISVDTNDLEKETIDSIRIATVGDSDKMVVGSIAIVIGNAMGYGQSFTSGYISALNREVEIDGITRTLLQTDAAINPGNSGGPMLNAYGEVIGIASAKLVSNSIEGVCYAIPMSIAIPIINELMNRVDLKKSEIGYLGIDGKDVNETYALAFGMPVGVYVFEVTENSPAMEAGIRVGDIVTAVNDRPVKTMEELKNQLNYLKAGTEITLKVASVEKNRYQEKDVKVTLSKRP